MFAITFILPAIVAAILFYKYFLHPAFLSPLSKIPNAHFTSAFCPVWILWIRFRGRQNRTLFSCHRRLGPVIRLGPSELSVDCVDGGIRTIYGGGFEKSNWYSNQYRNFGVPNMFSTTEREPHSVRKRMISNVYSKSYLQSSPEVHEISHSLIRKRLLPLLNIFAETERSVDVLELNHAIAMDFICAYLFGLSSGTNFIQDAKYRKHWLDQYKRRKSPHTFWTAELPALRSLLEKIGIMVIPAYIKSANREIERSCYNMCQSAEDSIYKAEANPTSPVVYKQLSQSLEKTHAESGNTDSYPKSLKVASEMLDHLAAGQETTGITLTYVMYCLSQRPALQFALREELVTFSSSLRFQSTSATDTVSAPDLPSARSLDALPLLHAVLMETLRLHTAIPGPQPRLTPHNPAIPTKLGEYGSIPGGVRVSALGYTLHRSEKAFPEPEQWKPERWLNAEKDQKEEMLRWFWAFGSGGRMCIGSNFAMMEMKLVLAAIYVNFTTAIVDDAGIEQADRYTASPVSKKLILRLTRVS